MKTLKVIILKVIWVINTILAIYGFAQLLWMFVIKPLFVSSVTVIAPPKIYSHEEVVFGTYYPKNRDYQVRVYVNPDDGTHQYWLQYQTWQTPPNGEWVDVTRFGNPSGRDMVKPPPLDFDVFAVLVKSTDMAKLPGSDSGFVRANSHEVFKDILKQAGLKTISTPFRLERLPEQACDVPKDLSINGITVVTAKKDLQVYSPIRWNWEPKRPLFVEVWKGGSLFKNKRHSFNDSTLTLDPGVYELKIREREGIGCFTNVWIEVLSPK